MYTGEVVIPHSPTVLIRSRSGCPGTAHVCLGALHPPDGFAHIDALRAGLSADARGFAIKHRICANGLWDNAITSFLSNVSQPTSGPRCKNLEWSDQFSESIIFLA